LSKRRGFLTDFPSLWKNENAALFDSYQVGFEVDACWRTFRSPVAEIKSSVMFGTFDDIVHDQAAGQVHLPVCTQAVSSIVSVALGSINGEGASVVIESDYVGTLDLIDSANFDPLAHLGHF
jgi:hypothetical protein